MVHPPHRRCWRDVNAAHIARCTDLDGVQPVRQVGKRQRAASSVVRYGTACSNTRLRDVAPRCCTVNADLSTFVREPGLPSGWEKSWLHHSDTTTLIVISININKCIDTRGSHTIHRAFRDIVYL